MRSLLSTAGLARASARHPWRILGLWAALLLLAGGLIVGLGIDLTTAGNFTSQPESLRGAKLVEQRLRGQAPVTETVVVRSETATVDDPAFRQVVESTTQDLLGLQGVVKQAVNVYQLQATGAPQAASMVSPDRHATIISVTLQGTYQEAHDHADAYVQTVERHGGNGFQVLTAGDVSIGKEFTDLAETDLRRAEVFGLPAALVVLVVVFGALVAAGVPIVLALASIAVAIGLTAVVGRFTDLSVYVVNMITMIGLAVGIDYALFIISRYREERRHGLEKIDAITVAGGTASKAVLFSGGTVVLALASLLLIPVNIFRSLGAGAVLVVIVAVLAMLTLVPALLSLLGDRVDWPRRQQSAKVAAVGSDRWDEAALHRGFWGRLTRLVMGHPVVSLVLAAGLMATLAVPYADLKKGQAGVETLPESDVKTAYAILNRDFSAGLVAPVEVVVDAPRSDQTLAAIAKLTASLGQQPIFGPVMGVQWNQAGDLALLQVPLRTDSSSPEAVQAVKTLRHDLIPTAFAGTGARVYVSGAPAFNTDFFGLIDESTPLVFAFVLGLSFLLLLLAFRSLVVPAKAILMNLLSVGATYGLMVLVFQKGYGHDLLGFQRTPTIEAWVPILLFSVLFGLSMDYHVFLLSRIREHYDASQDNRASVAVGLQSTGRLITGAALIMVFVFAGFAAGKLAVMQQMGFGLAVAVLLDATVVRTILVPSAMALLGDLNWYLPRWLHWLPDLRIEGGEAHVAPAAVPAERQPVLEGAD